MKKKILFQLSGSIACFKAAAVISKLVQMNYEVQCVATPSALQFIGASTLEGLTGQELLTNTFQKNKWMDHIELNKWADLVVLCPATANRINKMAAGIADDLVGNLFLTFDFQKPFLIAPAMNTKMYQHPITQASISKLKEMGVTILETESGMLACGDVGEGRMMEPEELIKQIQMRLK